MWRMRVRAEKAFYEEPCSFTKTGSEQAEERLRGTAFAQVGCATAISPCLCRAWRQTAAASKVPPAWASAGAGAEASFLRHFILNTEQLPRQARDKHRGSSKKDTFPQGAVGRSDRTIHAAADGDER